MPRENSRWWWFAIVAIVLAVWKAPAAGQSTSASPDVLNALLTEVRGLRAAMEQMASAGPRVQLAMGRLQLQEQRVNTMLRRLDEVRQKLADAEREVTDQKDQLGRAQEASTNGESTAERLAALDLVRQLKVMLDRGSPDVQRLRNEEAELAATLATEQARWVEINQRLDDLDRALIRR